MSRALAMTLLLALGLNTQARAASERDVQERVGISQRLGQTMPLTVTFVDERGVVRPLGAYVQGRAAIIALVYFECPNLCTLTLNSLAASLKHLDLAAGRDYEVLAISIDPREGPALAGAKRSTFVNHYGSPSCRECDPGWHFLTGRSEDIRAVTEALGYRYFWDANESQYAHPAGIVLVSPQGRIAQYFNGLEFPPSELQRALQTAAAGRTGSLAERVWLLCFHYAALAGRYSGAISILLRILALATVAALATLIFRLVRSAS